MSRDIQRAHQRLLRITRSAITVDPSNQNTVTIAITTNAST
jgi:hypothetical protein